MKKLMLPLLLAAFLTPLGARAQTSQRAPGPAVVRPTGIEQWGPDSRCEAAGIRGGVLYGSNGFAWLYSEGWGDVLLQAELETPAGDLAWVAVLRGDGSPYGAGNGGGLTERTHLPGPSSVKWTGRYRSMCFSAVPAG